MKRSKVQKIKNGFTMIELLLVIAMMGTMVFVMVRQYDNSESYVENAMYKIASNIRYAQDRAMVTGRVHGFQTNGAHQYLIYDQTPDNLTLDPSTLEPLTQNLEDIYPGVTFLSDYHIEFNSYGAPTFGAGISITIRKGSASRTFSINSNTGTINLP